MVDLPKLYRKKEKTEPVEFITGDVDEETQQKINVLKEISERYEPTEINESEIEDIGDQLADYLLDFMRKNGVNPIPGDSPVNLSRASELCTIATTQQHVGFLLMKQEECDKAEVIPWIVKYSAYIIMTGICACLPVGLMIAYLIFAKK